MKLLALAFAGTLLATSAIAGNSPPSESTWHTPGPGAAYHGESYKNNAVAAVGRSGYDNISTASYDAPEAGNSFSRASYAAPENNNNPTFAAVGRGGYDNITIA